MDKTYNSIEAFARDFPRFSRELNNRLVVEYHRLNHKEGRRLLQAEIPTVTGELKASLRDSGAGSDKVWSGYKHPDQLKKPGGTRIISRHRAFHALDFGRRKSSPYERGRQKGMVRTLGSESAPRGFTTPASEKLLSKGRQARLRIRAFRSAWKRAQR